MDMSERSLEVQRLGRVAYADGLDLQKRLESEVIEQRGPDLLLLLEHPHTFTIGRRSKTEGVLATAEMLKKLGVEVFETNRGGKVTYHGLGQIVGYPIISLSPDREDVHKYVRDVEEVLIAPWRTSGLKHFGSRDSPAYTRPKEKSPRSVSISSDGSRPRIRTQRKHRSQLLQLDHRLRRRTGDFDEPLLDREIDMTEVEDRIVRILRMCLDIGQRTQPGSTTCGSGWVPKTATQV
jgi:hypothetical protein